MIVTILDLGTNTFNILVAEIQDHQHQILHIDKMSVKLGEGSINQNFISQLAYHRGLEAIDTYHKRAVAFKSDKIIAVGTSALRGAKNGQDFIRQIKQNNDIGVHIINGKEEANLIHKGVLLAIPELTEKFLIMDIGGGSTEFIISEKDQTKWCNSYLLGAARLLQKHHISDPITNEEIKELEHYFENSLESLFYQLKKEKVDLMIGSSGSFDTFAEMILHKFYTPFEIEKLRRYDFNLDDFHHIYHKLIKSTQAERLQMDGLIPMRADMIVIAAIFTNYVLKKSGISKMKLSAYSLKEGILYCLIHDIPYL